MGVKEDLGDTRPYWKVLVSLVFSLTAPYYLYMWESKQSFILCRL